MAYQLTSEFGLLRVVFLDVIMRHDLQSLAVDVAAAQQQYAVAPNRLADLRQIARHEVTFADVLSYAEQRRARRLANPVKTAIVADQPAQVGYARMFQTLLEHPQIEVQIFPTVALAEAWIAEP